MPAEPFDPAEDLFAAARRACRQTAGLVSAAREAAADLAEACRRSRAAREAGRKELDDWLARGAGVSAP